MIQDALRYTGLLHYRIIHQYIVVLKSYSENLKEETYNYLLAHFHKHGLDVAFVEEETRPSIYDILSTKTFAYNATLCLNVTQSYPNNMIYCIIITERHHIHVLHSFKTCLTKDKHGVFCDDPISFQHKAACGAICYGIEIASRQIFDDTLYLIKPDPLCH